MINNGKPNTLKPEDSFTNSLWFNQGKDNMYNDDLYGSNLQPGININNFKGEVPNTNANGIKSILYSGAVDMLTHPDENLITINSGYRLLKKNSSKGIKGSKTSRHLVCAAIDVYTSTDFTFWKEFFNPGYVNGFGGRDLVSQILEKHPKWNQSGFKLMEIIFGASQPFYQYVNENKLDKLNFNNFNGKDLKSQELYDTLFSAENKFKGILFGYIHLGFATNEIYNSHPNWKTKKVSFNWRDDSMPTSSTKQDETHDIYTYSKLLKMVIKK